MWCRLLTLLVAVLLRVQTASAGRDKMSGLSFTFPAEVKIQRNVELCVRFDNLDRLSKDHFNMTVRTDPFDIIKPLDFQVFAKTKMACYDVRIECNQQLIISDINTFRLKVVANVAFSKYCFEKEIKIKSGKEKCLIEKQSALLDVNYLRYLMQSKQGYQVNMDQLRQINEQQEDATVQAVSSEEENSDENSDVESDEENEQNEDYPLSNDDLSETINFDEAVERLLYRANKTIETVANTINEDQTQQDSNEYLANDNESSNETSILLLKTIKPSLKPIVMNALIALSDELVAIGSSDSTIQIWDTKRSILNRTLTGHSGRVMSLCLFPNGDLASGATDKTIRIWDMNSGEQKMLIKSDSGGYVVLETLDNERIASSFSDQTIKIWNVTSGEQILKLVGHTRKVYSLAKLDNGDLVSGSADKTIKVWNTTDGTLKHTFLGHSDSVESLCPLADGRFASGSWDATIKLWNSEEKRLEQTLEGHNDSIFSLVKLPNEDLASGSLDKTIRIWNSADGKLKRSINIHHYGVRRMTLLSNDNLITIGYTEQKIKIWNTTALSEPRRYY